jgi:hypothetical protein
LRETPGRPGVSLIGERTTRVMSYERYDEIRVRGGCVIGGVEGRGSRCEPFIFSQPLPLQPFVAFRFSPAKGQ